MFFLWKYRERPAAGRKSSRLSDCICGWERVEKKERYSSRIVPPPNPMAATAEERKTAAKEKRLKVNEDTSHHKQI